ncbi:MAG TPA: RsmE family RNA methyltransferase [Gemmatimonadales bacterium]
MIVLVPPGRARPGVTIPLDDDESHHLRVRRAEPGETVQLRDGAGLDGVGLLDVSGRAWSVRVTEAAIRPPRPVLTLAVGTGDRERFLWLVEKAAELGVSRVVPIETERTSGVASRLRPAHIEKLARRALEATKQSGAHWGPEIESPAPFAEFIATARPGSLWLADGAGATPAVREGEITVLIGPEGGFTTPERSAAIAAGWTPVSLGPNVLRFETAAIAAAAHVGIERGRRT